MDLSDLRPDERADFEKRVARLGVDPQALDDDTLEVEPGASMRLEMAGESPVSPMIFQTSDLDVLRRWIGTPDLAVAQRTTQPYEAIIRNRDAATHNFAAPARDKKRRLTKKATGRKSAALAEITGVEPSGLLAAVNRAKLEPAQARLNAVEVDTIRAAARTYIHGDKKVSEAFKPAIEAYFGEFQIAVWLKKKIVVKKNATLTLGTGVHNLTAYELVIEPGGRIRSHGHLTVSVTKIRRPTLVSPGLSLPNHVLTVNTLPRRRRFP